MSTHSNNPRPASLSGPPITFESYREYTWHVTQVLSEQTTLDWNKELWLGQLSTDGKPLQWYRFASDAQDKSAGWKTHGADAAMYRSTGSEDSFRDLLKTPSSQCIGKYYLYSATARTV